MKRLYRYIMPALLPAALLLPGCTADDDLVPATPGDTATLPGETAGIYVTGSGLGQPSAPATRYVPPTGEAGEPGHDTQPGDHNEGICRADLVDVFVWHVDQGYTMYDPSYDQYTWESTTTKELTTSGRDRYSEVELNISKEHNYEYLLTTALAYTGADKEAGRFATQVNGRLNSTLTIPDGKTTPELYYGILRVLENSVGGERDDKDEDMFWYYKFGASSGTATVGGRIFRAVSRFDLSLTDIPTNVEGLDLLVTNVPKVMGLSGSHGTYYPVTAVTDTKDVTAAETVVASVDLAEGQDEATLSAFFLPSEVGMQMKLRVRMRQDREADELADDSQLEDGKDYRDFDLLPPKSYFLTGEDAAVYNVGSGLKAEDGSGNLYVYDNRRGHNCFYSYANVLVTMHGKFENVAAETTTVDVEIEVEPNFEHANEGLGVDTNFDVEHHYQIK